MLVTETDLLRYLKLNLSIASTAKDEYLTMLIRAAKTEILREGILLGESTDDANLVVMYAAYLFRKRAESAGGAMPRMLRYALNNRLLAQKGAVSNLDTGGYV